MPCRDARVVTGMPVISAAAAATYATLICHKDAAMLLTRYAADTPWRAQRYSMLLKRRRQLRRHDADTPYAACLLLSRHAHCRCLRLRRRCRRHDAAMIRCRCYAMPFIITLRYATPCRFCRAAHADA